MKLEDLQKFRNKQGVYFLYDGLEQEKRCVYIGFSRNIYTRLLEHNFDKSKKFNNFNALEIKDFNLANLVEIIMIKKICPKYNKLISNDNTNTLLKIFSPFMEFEKDSILAYEDLVNYFIWASDDFKIYDLSNRKSFFELLTQDKENYRDEFWYSYFSKNNRDSFEEIQELLGVETNHNDETKERLKSFKNNFAKRYK